MMNNLHWVALYEAFAAFAAMARQYKFYDDEVNRMEKSLFEMCPVKRKDGTK